MSSAKRRSPQIHTPGGTGNGHSGCKTAMVWRINWTQRKAMQLWTGAVVSLCCAVPLMAQTSTGSFRLEPEDGRTPGVAGPANEGIPPLGPTDTAPPRQPVPVPVPVTRPDPVAPAPTVRRVVPDDVQAGRTVPAPKTATPARPQDRAPETLEPATPVQNAPSQPVAADASDAPLPADVLLAPADESRPVADAAAVTATPSTGGADWLNWWPALAVLVFGAGGWWVWKRRRVAMTVADVLPVDVVPVPQASPPAALKPVPVAKPVVAAVPVPVARANPPPLPDFLTAPPPPVSTARASVTMALEVTNLRTSLAQLGSDFVITLTNRGPLAATGVLVRLAFEAGNAAQEATLTRFYDGMGGGNWREIEEIGAGETVRLTGDAKLPLAGVAPLMVGDKPLLIPVLAVDVTYNWDGPGEAFGQVARAFVLGQEPIEPNIAAKLGPVRLDWGPRRYHPAGARPTALERIA